MSGITPGNIKVRITQHLKINRPDWNRQLYIDELIDKAPGVLVVLAINRPLDQGKGESLAIPLDKDDLRKVVETLTKILNQE